MKGGALALEGVDVFRESVRGPRRQVVHALSLSIAPGERVALTGPNGAGKTSLLLALVGAVPWTGRVIVDDVELTRRRLGEVRARVGLVFADPADQLFADTVHAEVAFGPIQRGLPANVVDHLVREALHAVGLRGFEERAPLELSLGEQRRLAIATALALRAQVLLLDEPTTSLDPLARQAVLEAVRQAGATVVVATHDLDAALALSARVVLLKEGRLVEDGPAERVLTDAALLAQAGLALPLTVAASATRRLPDT